MTNMKSSISFSVMRAAAKEVGQAAPLVDGFAIDVPSEVFQTIYDAEGRQDSSTPLGPLRVALSQAAQAAVARSSTACVKVALRRFDGRFLEEYDPDTGSLVPLHVPACVFTVAAVDGGRAISILMKRKYLPTSASFGNAPVVLVVSVLAPGGALAQVAVSSRFTILSKQPRARKPSKPPKRIRNPPPAKPVRRSASAAELALSALLLGQEAAGQEAAGQEPAAVVAAAMAAGADEDGCVLTEAVPAAASVRSAGRKRAVRPRDHAEEEEAAASDSGGSTATEEEEDDDVDEEVGAVLPAAYAPGRPTKHRRCSFARESAAELCDALTSLGLDHGGVVAALEPDCSGERGYEEYDADQEEGDVVVLPAAAPPTLHQHPAGGLRTGLRGALTACLPPPPPQRLDSFAALPGEVAGSLFGLSPAGWSPVLRSDSALSQGL